MGFLKKVGKSIAKALPSVGAAVGAYFGGPAGAQAGYRAGGTAKSLVSGNSRDFRDSIKSNIGNASVLFGGPVGAVGLGGLSADVQSLASDADLNYWNIERQKELAAYNVEQQMKLNEQIHSQNMELWNLQNAYNSPEAQMARYEKAGLNPNLIYDQSNTASGVPMLEAPKYDTGPYNPVDTRVQRAQLALALQEHKLQIQNQAIENDMKRQQLILSARASDREDKLADAQIKNLSATLGIRSEELGIHHGEVATRQQEIKEQNAWRRYQDDIRKYENDIDNIRKRSLFPNGGSAERAIKKYKSSHRYPMYMDYL